MNAVTPPPVIRGDPRPWRRGGGDARRHPGNTLLRPAAKRPQNVVSVVRRAGSSLAACSAVVALNGANSLGRDLDAAVIFRHIAEPLVLLDRDGRIIYANEAFSAIVGRCGQDLRGLRWSDLAEPAPSETNLADGVVCGERDDIRQLRHALEIHRWNASQTARDLGISRTTLWRRMRKFGLLDRA